MFGQWYNIFLPLIQGGYLNFNDTQTKVKIFSEEIVTYHVSQIFVCGRYHPSLNTNFFCAADPLEFTFFKKAQQLCLGLMA